ncbi:MAG TPA: dTMP kinase [Actinomycetota bacterium]
MSSLADEVAALRGTKPATLKDLFRLPAFSKLMAAMAVSSLGDWVGFVAVASLVQHHGGSVSGASFAVAGVMIARMLPSILFGPFAGVLVDRVNRKRLMISADITRGALYATMPFIGVLWGIYAMSFCIECLALLWVPAKDSSVPNLVPRRQLVNANTVSMATTYGTLPLGGIIFAVLTGVALTIGHRVTYFNDHPESLSLWLDAATFVFSAVMVSRLPDRAMQPKGGQRFKLSHAGKDIRDGISFLRGHPLARAMTAGIVVAFIGVGSVIAIGPVFANRTVHAGPPGWGALVTALGVGMGIGMAFVPQISKFVDRDLLFPATMLGAAIVLAVVAAMPNISLAALFTVLMGVFAGATWVNGYALLQENVADEYRGRTFATLTVMSRLGLFASLAGFPVLSGILGDHGFDIGQFRVDLSGTRLALWIGAAIAAVGAVVARRGLKRNRLTKPVGLTLMPRLKKGPRRGVLIAFEGVEGAGKGTQIRMAREWLETQGWQVLVSREPGGTPVGERLRELLLDPDTGQVEPRTEALLFAASRSQHVATVIRPALEDGKVVLCDRYIDSSLAYQGAARGVGEQNVLNLNVWATDGLFPDLVILLHVEPDLGLLRGTGDGPDRIELEGSPFMAKVADAYLRIAEEHPERFVVIDSDRPPDEVHNDVRDAIRRLVRSHTAVDTPAHGTTITREMLDAGPPAATATGPGLGANPGADHGNGSGPSPAGGPPARRATDRTDG